MTLHNSKKRAGQRPLQDTSRIHGAVPQCRWDCLSASNPLLYRVFQGETEGTQYGLREVPLEGLTIEEERMAEMGADKARVSTPTFVLLNKINHWTLVKIQLQVSFGSAGDIRAINPRVWSKPVAKTLAKWWVHLWVVWNFVCFRWTTQQTSCSYSGIDCLGCKEEKCPKTQ